ncbi:DUF982 domain-containing protein [Pararhizobium qamdonense]|uniref:DUF982 domain-containing protein n=1 Tax=Pararhizobium qamdonense TaxID=3031126 RepID=UPI0023E0AFBD|nr:DUF982 domain-containing protein [Pararhizobium qamdonense]
MAEIFWEKPLLVVSHDGGQLVILGPSEALRNLDTWISREGWFFERAKDKCHAALEMGLSPKDARRAFVAAAPDMNIPFA